MAGERILVVEDEDLVRGALERMLQAVGYGVDSAPNGQSGLDRLREAHSAGVQYALILCDVLMPGLDGPTFYQTAREEGIDGGANVLFLTGYMDDKEAKVRELSPFEPLKKPITLKDLTEAVKQAIAYHPSDAGDS